MTLCALVALCVGPGMGAPLHAQTTKPNVLFITVDDLNDYVGFLGGHPQAETPHMDALAREGMVFTNAYCNSPACAPSRTSMITGKRPEYTGIFENEVYNANPSFRDLFSDSTGNGTIYTLPEVMKDQGDYFTYNLLKIFHGWFLQGYDNDFDETTVDPCAKGQSWNKLIDFRPTNNPDPITDNPYHHGFLRYKFGPLLDSQEPQMNEVKSLDSLVSFLNTYENLPSAFCDKPFFVAFGTSKPHVPYYVPERYYLPYYENDFYLDPFPIPYNNPPDLFPPNGLIMPTRFPDGLSGRETLGIVGENIAKGNFYTEYLFQSWAQELSPKPTITSGLGPAEVDAVAEEAKKAQAVMSYLASIKYADVQIGRIMDELDSRPGLRDNTIIVLVSDHGYSLGEREHWHKFGLWETDIRIPMIIVDPRKPIAGSVSHEVVSLIDLFPTILELAGVPEPTFPDGSRYLDGRSLVPILNNPALRTSATAVSTFKGPDRLPEGSCFPHYSIRSDQFHYIYHRTNAAYTDSTGTPCDFPNSRLEEELYEIGKNREIDPEEFYNLAYDSAYADEIAYLSQWLPGGPFESKNPLHLQIDPATIPCLITKADTLYPAFSLTNPDGSPATISPDMQFEWKLDPPGWIGMDTLALSLLPPTEVDKPLRLSVKMTSSIDSSSFLYHSIPIRVRVAEPDLSFTISATDRVVEIDSLSSVPLSTETTWDYGDGFVTKGAPVKHTYSSPGPHQITRRVKFSGSELSGSCTLEQTATFSLSPTLFPSDTCFTPTNLAMQDISSGKVRLNWSAVAGANNYELRVKRAREEFTDPWYHRAVNGTTYTTPAVLHPNTEYIMQLSAHCPSGQSDWSYPMHFTSPRCDAPRDIEIISVEPNKVNISWTPNDDPTVSSSQVGYLKTGTINLNTKGFSPAVTAFEIGGLAPGTTYEIRGWSKCQQLVGPTLLGDISSGQFFTTPHLRDFDQPDVKIFPNPATEQLSLQIDRVDGPASLRVADANDRTLISRKLEQQDAQTDIILSVKHLPAGVYFLSIQTAKTVVIKRFVKL